MCGDRRLYAFPSRHHNQIRFFECTAWLSRVDRKATAGAKRPVIDSIDRATIPVLAHLWPRQAKDLPCDSEFERAKPIIGKHRHARTEKAV